MVRVVVAGEGMMLMCVLRVRVDHFVDHFASVGFLGVKGEHGFIKSVDCPEFVYFEEGREVVKCCCCCSC